MSKNLDTATQKIIQQVVKSGQKRRNKKMLVVEDNLLIAKMWENALRKRGYANIILAANGDEGIKSFKEEKPDLVILDVLMPGKDGFTVCKEMREIEKSRDLGDEKAVIFFLSNLIQSNCQKKALEIGAQDFFSKCNIGPKDLADKVDGYLGFEYQEEIDAAVEEESDETGALNVNIIMKRFDAIIDDQGKQLEEFNEKIKAARVEIKALKMEKRKYERAKQECEKITQTIDDDVVILEKSEDFLLIAESGLKLLKKIINQRGNHKTVQETIELVVEKIAIAVSKLDAQRNSDFIQECDVVFLAEIYAHPCFVFDDEKSIVRTVLLKISEAQETKEITEEEADELKQKIVSSRKKQVSIEDEKMEKIRSNMQILSLKS